MKIKPIVDSNFLFKFNTPISFFFYMKKKDTSYLLLLLIVSINYNTNKLNDIYASYSTTYKKNWSKRKIKFTPFKDSQLICLPNYKTSSTFLFNKIPHVMINYSLNNLCLNVSKNFKNLILKSGYTLLSFTKALVMFSRFIFTLNRLTSLTFFTSINALWFISKTNLVANLKPLTKRSLIKYFNVRSGSSSLLTFNTKVL